jgi:hypothetical protein
METPPPLSQVPVPVTASPTAPRVEAVLETAPLTPIHPAAAALLLFVDNLWNVADWAAVLWIITIPLSFLSVFVPTLVLQRLSRRDRWPIALGKAFALGAVAAVPTSLSGTPVGMALLAWAGVERWRR